jgi:hypothetical protein
VATHSDGTKGYRFTVRPNFIDASASGRCTVTEEGTCRTISCPTSRSSLRSASAGAVHLKAGSHSADLLPEFNGYPNVQETGAFFEGGEELSIRGDGDAVRSFSTQVTAPSPVMVTAPLDATVVVSKTQELTLTWTGDSAGVLVFQLSGKVDQNDVKVQCRFLPSAGTAVVPGSAFEALPAGKYTAQVFTRSRAVVAAGDWSVVLEGVYFAGVKDVSAFDRPARVE